MKTKKIVILVAAFALVIAMSVAGTLAWLAAETAPVTNVFTPSSIGVTLEETTNDYKMVPGSTIAKDPTITVTGGSEACWLFVKVEESENYDDFNTYAMADGWTALTGVDGVFYRSVTASDDDQDFAVIKDNKVTVKDSVTKEMMDALTEESYPTLTFTAYAVQSENIATAAAAWAIAVPTETL